MYVDTSESKVSPGPLHLSGLEKENYKPEDRQAKKEEYNQMMLNNLERLAERKKGMQDRFSRSKSRESHEKFVGNFERGEQSPRSISHSSNSRSLTAQQQYPRG